MSATFADVDSGDSHTCSINWGDGSAPSSGTVADRRAPRPERAPLRTSTSTTIPPGTPVDTYNVTVTITDNGTTNGSADAKSGSATLKVTIANLAPIITGIEAAADRLHSAEARA